MTCKIILWLSRRLANMERFREAINILTKGINRFSETPELYRYRGQYHITLRNFQQAVKDLEKSAALVKDMPVTLEPEATPIPMYQGTSTLQFNIWYQLGLAYYLSGDYGKAAQAYEKCLTFCEHDDEIAATADWLYLTYRRLGEDEVAEKTLELVAEDMHVQVSDGYFEKNAHVQRLYRSGLIIKTG